MTFIRSTMPLDEMIVRSSAFWTTRAEVMAPILSAAPLAIVCTPPVARPLAGYSVRGVLFP